MARRRKQKVNNNWNSVHKDLRPGDELGTDKVVCSMFIRSNKGTNLFIVLCKGKQGHIGKVAVDPYGVKDWKKLKIKTEDKLEALNRLLQKAMRL